MSFNYNLFFRKVVLIVFCILSCGGVFSGALLGMVKSPENHSASYLALADYYAGQAETVSGNDTANFMRYSENMTLQAIELTPYDQKLWDKLSEIRSKQQNLAQNLAMSEID